MCIRDSVDTNLVTCLSRVSRRSPRVSPAEVGVCASRPCRSPGCVGLVPRVAPRSRSRGVDVIFRVYTTSGSGSWVRRTGFGLTPLDVGPCRFPRDRLSSTDWRATARIPKKPNDSPRDLHLSLRVGPSARPPSSTCFRRNSRPIRAPLMRFSSPSAFKVGSVHSPSDRHRGVCHLEPRVLPSRFVPPSSFRTTSTVCSVPDRPEFPRVTLMGFCPSGSLPITGGPARRRTCRPLLPFRCDSLAAGLASDRCAFAAVDFRVSLQRTDRHRSSSVSR
jgi:hypothetical protein